jgi:hypothetical protein
MTNTPNPMFQKFDQALGVTTPTPTNGSKPVTSRADEIRNLAKASMPQEDTNMNKIGNTPIVGGVVGGVMKSTGNAVINAANDTEKTVKSNFQMANDYATNPDGTKSIPKAIGGSLLAGAKSVVDIGGGVVKGLTNSVADTIAQYIPQDVKDKFAGGVKDVSTKISTALSEPTDNTDLLHNQQFRDFIIHVTNTAKDNPETMATIGNGISMVLAPSMLEGGIGVVKKAGDVVSNIVEKTAPIVKGITNDVSGTISDTVGNVKGAIGTEISEAVKGKPEAKILATPESDVKKLSPSERKVWFDNQKTVIETNATKTSQEIKANLNKQVEQTSKTGDALEKELATASRDKVIELRPKIVKAMGEQSKVYRSLIDEEMAGKESIPVNTNDLKSAIDSQYGDNPSIANSIKERLGLNETPSNPLKKGELPSIQTQEPQTTLGEIYNKIKSLKQDISSGAVKGSKTFTSDDVMTDKAINTLTSFMKKSGVDFSEANKFWSKYAPIRDQLVNEAKPFIQTGTQTKTFASTLSRVARGTDVNNENFIKEVENLLGKPVNKENEAIVKKITTNQKQQIADKVSAQEKSIANEMAKDKSLSKLSSKEFEIERQAKLRSYVKKTIITVLGLEVANKLGITKMLGL